MWPQKDASGKNLQSVSYKYVVYENDIALAHGTFQKQIYHRVLSQTETVRGVSQTTSYTYNSKGQKNSKTVTGFQNGVAESHITEWVYCWETNDFYKDQNLLTFVERVTSSVQVGDVTTIVKMIYNEYKDLNPYQMTSAYLYQQYEAVDFVKAQTAPITDSTAWRLIKQVNERDSDGAILEEQGAMGEVISYLRTADSIPYATLMGASFQKGEGFYYGGESYEDQTKWKLSGGVALGKGARLNAGAYFWADTDGALTYTQGLQIKAGENYTVYLRVYGEQSGSKVSVSFKDKTLSQNLQPGWQVVQFDIANADIIGASDFVVSLGGRTGLDYVLLRPQRSHMSVDVYDAEKRVAMSYEGVLSTTRIYDPISGVPITSYASTSSGTESYYSGGKTSGLTASYPGQDLILSGKTYMDAPSCHMSVDFSGSEYVTLRSEDVALIPLGSDDKAYAVVFDLDIKTDQTVTIKRGVVNLTFVTQTQDEQLTVTVNYTDPAGTKGTNTVSYDLSSPLYPLRHVVVFHPYQLSWFMGGASLFSCKMGSPIDWDGSNLSVSVTHNSTDAFFSPFVIGESPLLTCQFIDEQGRVLQNQEWTYLNNEEPYLSTVCTQNFYDNNGAFLAKSHPMVYDSTRLGEYQKTLATFSMHDSVNVGEMSGDVVDYWKQRDAFNAPYAYESVVRENRPGGAIVATCAPGFYNRNYVLGSGGVDHNATTIERQVSIPSFYGISSEDAGHFMRERSRKPWLGALMADTTTVKDSFGRVVGRISPDGSKMSTQYRYGQEGSVHSQTGQSPLSYEGDDATKYESSSTTWDPLGLHHTLSFPDTGETEHITNLSGQTVFARDAEGSSGDDPVVRYNVYDDAGRLIEKGLLHMAWDTDKLMACALSETFPTGVSSLWKTICRYDSQGRMKQDQYNNSDDSVGVVMVRDYQYNAQGSVTSVTESRWDGGLSGTKKYAYTTAYTYDALGVRLESVVYPDGQTVYFTYDAMGRLYCKSSEKGGKGTIYLRMKRYTEKGQVHCYTTGNDRYTTLLDYDIQDRLVKEEVWDGGQKVWGENFAYSHGEKFDAGGPITEKEISGSAVSQAERYTYRYDREGQLVEVYSLTDNRLYFPAGSKRKYRVLLNNDALDCDDLFKLAVCCPLSTSSSSNIISVEVDSAGQYFKMRNNTGYLGSDALSDRALGWGSSSQETFSWHDWGVGDLDFGYGLSRYLRNSTAFHIIPGREGSRETILIVGPNMHYNSVLVPMDNDGDMYQYDRNGNMTSDNGESRSYNDGTNQMNSFAMTYDANGRVVSYDKGLGQVNISYDKNSGLFNAIAYEKEGGAKRTFYRNAGGRIVETVNQAGTSYLTLRGGGTEPLRRIEMASGKETSSANYVHGLQGICYVYDSVMGDFSCLNDYQGALRLTFDTNGQKKGEITYDAWGMPKVLQGDAIHPFYRNDHEYVDDFQIFEAGARLYDPYLKRFLEPDPKMLNHSPYTAFNNNPIIFIDYSGLQPGMSIMLYNIDEGRFLGSCFELMWERVYCVPVRFKACPLLETDPIFKLGLQSDRSVYVSAKGFIMEQPEISAGDLEFTGHIMVALEHGLRSGGIYKPVGMTIRGVSAFGKSYPNQRIKAGKFMEEPSFFEKPLGRTVMDCIEREIPVKTISMLKCGANPAQMIRAVRRAILSEAEARGCTPEMMARVEGVMKEVRLNVVDGPYSIGDRVPNGGGLNKYPFSEDSYLFTDKFDKGVSSDRVNLSAKESEDFMINGTLPEKKRFMKAYSIAKEIPQGEGEERAVMEASEMAEMAETALFLLRKDALKDEWTESFEDRKFSKEEQVILEKIKEGAMDRLEWTQNVDIKEVSGHFLFANKGYTLFVHPIILDVLSQWSQIQEEKDRVLSLFMENELRQIQAKEGWRSLTENDVNDLEFDSWVKVLQNSSYHDYKLLQNFMDFAFSSETDARQLFDEAFEDMREKGFHVAFDKDDELFQERVSTDDISKRLIAVGVLRQRMFSSPQSHFSTSV